MNADRINTPAEFTSTRTATQTTSTRLGTDALKPDLYPTTQRTSTPRVTFSASRLRLALGCQELWGVPRQGLGSSRLAPIPQGMWPGGTETRCRATNLPAWRYSMARQSCLMELPCQLHGLAIFISAYKQAAVEA